MPSLFELHPQQYGYSSEATLVDWQGTDSEVWRIDTMAVKIFPYQTLEKIQNYQALTNQAAVFLSENPYTFPAGPYSFSVADIVPVDTVKLAHRQGDNDENTDTYVFSESKFVPGPNGFDLLKSDQLTFETCITELSFEEKAHLRQLRSAFATDPTMLHELRARLTTMSAALGTHLHHRGIEFVPLNIKFRMSDQNRVICTITDIASRINEIKSL